MTHKPHPPTSAVANKLSNQPSILTALFVACVFTFIGPLAALAAGPAAVSLGTAGNFVVLTKSGISTTGATKVTGDMGTSPISASAITGFGLTRDSANTFSTSVQVTGKVYAADYAVPTPTTLTAAIGDMQTAYADAAGRTLPTATELGAGNIGGLTLAPGLYKWGTGVTIPTDVTLAGGPNDVWIFQIGQTLTMSSGAHIVLSGGAQASNIFWVVAGQTTIGTTAVFNGTILDQVAIVLNTGAQLNGRALAQTAVTLDANSVTLSVAAATPPPTPAPVPAPTPAPTPTPAMCSGTDHSCQCATGNYCLFSGAMCVSPTSPCPVSTPAPTPTPATPATPAVPTASPASPATPATPVACTQDAKQCSDGSYVGRGGPRC